MASHDSGGGEKVFRFISDPGHKENLSGRVRAACITCRRKKVKCSGDIPCGPCEEKGIVCEGLTERKRPKKNADKRRRSTSTRGERRSSQDSRASDDTIRSKRSSLDSTSSRIDGDESYLQRPSLHLRKLGTGDSDDSGYASAIQQRRRDTGNMQLHLDARFPFKRQCATDSSFNENLSLEISPTASATHESNYVATREPTHASENVPSNPHSARDTPATPSTQSMEWQDNGHGATTRLITAAEALEEQALSLRRLASHQDTNAVDDARRQMTTFPVYSERTNPTTFSTEPMPGMYDDLSIMFGQRPSGTGFTPLPVDFNSWWDINTDLTSSLGYQESTSAAMLPGAVSDGLNASSNTAAWLCGNQYNTTSNANASEGRTTPVETVPDARKVHRNHHVQSQNTYGQLYPWPE